LDRRRFLQKAGATSAGLGATALLGATAACSSTGHPSAGGTTTTTTSGASGKTTTTAPSGPPPWNVLAASLTGSLVLPADAAYAGDALLYNEVFAPAPAAIAYCASTTDVQRCIGFVRQHGLELAARSGGHSYGGYSTSPGLVVDVSPLNTVAPGAGGGATATVGAGTPLIDVYSQLGAQGSLLPGGSCPTVGIAGLTLGGGIGVFGRAYGMTCDQIVALTVVTADGTARVCSPDANADLYWASQGGGGGNFGIVTSFTFRVQPIPDITLFTLEWPWAAASEVLDAWLHWMASAPSEAWANCQLLPAAANGSIMKVTGVYAGSTTAAQSALAPLLQAVGRPPSDQFVGPETYLNAMLIEAGCEGTPVAQCTSARYPFVAKSSYIDAPLPASGTAAVLAASEALAAAVPGAGGGIVFDGYGGAINRVAPGATAFVHRSAVACAQYSVTYGSAPPPSATVTAAQDWLGQTHGAFAPYATGSYQNYIDPTLVGWAEAYYGANLPRLQSVKAHYDPDDLFRFAQSIPLPAA
jgi:FAD/FMN-containing dehydrogenase